LIYITSLAIFLGLWVSLLLPLLSEKHQGRKFILFKLQASCQGVFSFIVAWLFQLILMPVLSLMTCYKQEKEYVTGIVLHTIPEPDRYDDETRKAFE